MVVPVSTRNCESLTPRSRMPGLFAASVAWRDLWMLAARRLDSLIFSWSSPAESATGVSCGTVALSPFSISREPGGAKVLV